METADGLYRSFSENCPPGVPTSVLANSQGSSLVPAPRYHWLPGYRLQRLCCRDSCVCCRGRVILPRKAGRRDPESWSW